MNLAQNPEPLETHRMTIQQQNHKCVYMVILTNIHSELKIYTFLPFILCSFSFFFLNSSWNSEGGFLHSPWYRRMLFSNIKYLFLFRLEYISIALVFIILSEKPLGKLQHAEVFLKQQLQQKPFTFFLKNLWTFLTLQLWILVPLLPLRMCTISTVSGPLIIYSSE